MNQRFEDTLLKAVDAVAGMAKDYRILEERNRLAFIKLQEQDEAILKLNRMLQEATKDNGDCDSCTHKHPEFKRARFTLSSEFPPPDVRTVEREASDIDLAVPEDFGGMVDPLTPAMVKPGKFEDALRQVGCLEWLESQEECEATYSHPKLYDHFFDVLMWRWVYNTVRL